MCKKSQIEREDAKEKETFKQAQLPPASTRRDYVFVVVRQFSCLFACLLVCLLVFYQISKKTYCHTVTKYT